MRTDQLFSLSLNKEAKVMVLKREIGGNRVWDFRWGCCLDWFCVSLAGNSYEFPCFVGASHLLGQLWLFCVGILIYRCGRLSFLAICGSLACKGVIRCFLRSWVACMQSGSGG
ncbi:hypothetical protein MTR_4g130260 [Medicago truncatula]|uniref:Uncharacterized protein n=1 Tax=Medicago truncatula TaxID=3880 RepID=G7JFH4_MEDTR|nr:hypothetical protein MTR_4g130260 [Medicago truncatula]